MVLNAVTAPKRKDKMNGRKGLGHNKMFGLAAIAIEPQEVLATLQTNFFFVTCVMVTLERMVISLKYFKDCRHLSKLFLYIE